MIDAYPKNQPNGPQATRRRDKQPLLPRYNRARVKRAVMIYSLPVLVIGVAVWVAI